MVKNRLFGSAFVYIFFTILNSAIPFFLLPVLTRLLTPLDYGIIANYNVLYNIILPVAGLSLAGSIARFYIDFSSQTEYKEQLFNAVCLSVACCIFLVFLLGLTYSFFWGWFQLPVFWVGVCIANCFIQTIIDIQLSLFRIKEKPLFFGLLTTGLTIANVGVSILLIYFFKMNWEGRLWGSLIGTFVFGLGIMAYWLFTKQIVLRFSFEKIKAYLMYGIPLIPHSLSWWLLYSADRYIITNHLGLAATGIYNVGFQFSMICFLLLSAINNAYVPWFYKKLKESGGTSNEISKYNLFLFFASVFMIVPVYCLRDIFSFFVGRQFEGISEFTYILLMSRLFDVIYFLHCNYFFYYKKNHIISLTTFSVGIIHVLISNILTREFGLTGACYAILLSTLLRGVILMVLAEIYFRSSVLSDMRTLFKLKVKWK